MYNYGYFFMEVEIPAKKEALLILADHLEELKKAGVKVRITLESDKFLGKETKVLSRRVEGTEEEYFTPEEEYFFQDEEDIVEERIEVVPEKQLLDTFYKMWPLIFLGGEVHYRRDSIEWKKPYIVISTDFERERVKCPFCGKEDDYLINYDCDPASSPSRCLTCGAKVFAKVEPDFYEYGDNVSFREEQAIVESPEKITIGVRIDEDTYLFFEKHKIELNAEDVLKMFKGLLIKHAPMSCSAEYVIKKARKVGTGKGIYIPSEWGDCEVLAIKIPEQSKVEGEDVEKTNL